VSLGYNTLVVLAGCALLGLACGTVGAFALLRGRALMADAVGHAALPGVVLAGALGAAMGRLLSKRSVYHALADQLARAGGRMGTAGGRMGGATGVEG
jgi:manganese/zinc/iron transport system permease protein